MKTSQQMQELVNLLKSKEVVFEDGLSAEETTSIEAKFGFKFPDDLKSFLQTALPISTKFVNWREALVSSEYAKEVSSWMEGPFEGILFDVEHNNFWFDDWGAKPEGFERQAEIVKEKYKTYPVLIPIFSHRYISSEPTDSDNPVFSVHQTDIIYYGYNLANYLHNEFSFALPESFEIPAKPKAIRFWTDVVELNISK